MINQIVKILQKNLRLKTALLVVVVFLIITASSILGTNIYKLNKAKAYAYDFGGMIMTYQPACVYLLACSCLTCNINGPACAGQEEVIFTPFGGAGSFVCPIKGFPYIGGAPAPGGQILGGGGAQNSPVQIGVSG